MYLHLGSGFTVDKRSIIGVFDMDNTTVSRNGRMLLKKAQEEGRVVDAADDLPKSFVLTEEYGDARVYISSISTQTLLKRSKIKGLSEDL